MKTVIKTLLAATVLVGSVAPVPAFAQIASGFNSTSLGRNDDGSSGLVTLPFAINFYGQTYSGVYVNNNGNLTFNSANSTYTPGGLGSGYSGQPIIAPFYADVDTNNVGSGVAAYGNGIYNGHQAFGATWDGVGYFSSADKLNTFQALLVDRSDVGLNDFDIIFKYGNINWETGDASGGNDGLGGTSAAVGFNAGIGDANGTYYQAPGSLQNGALIDGGPDALNGEQLGFQVRAGLPVAIPPVAAAAPEPGTWAMMILGFGVVGFAMRNAKRRSDDKFDAKIKKITYGAVA
ncbi:nidogen-like domain-containing protein [Sphingomonas bacterium]|uniref:nidogen-like domain-containing protein n=1 Tax=Sphingomonas bacterium TaxID=1895847 RepID=UPI00157635DE|nr:nidogen-like domain-containing protein [Sphingomonas bacterium]